RGVRVGLVEKHDLSFGTSRWSSKLVHGGLRYLASGNIGIARRSAVERGMMMTRNAPHLVHAMPQLVPLLPSMGRANRALVRTGFIAGDALRRLAGTRASTLPRSQRISAARAAELVPAIRREGLDGGLLSYDGQLIDDARLVVAVARTAAQHGARILTYVAASDVTGDSVRLTDQRTGESVDVTAPGGVRATGLWPAASPRRSSCGPVAARIWCSTPPRSVIPLRRSRFRFPARSTASCSRCPSSWAGSTWA